MHIALLGYGKMGKVIERIASERGHVIVMKIDKNNISEFNAENIKKKNVDVAIEFTGPDSAYENIHKCISYGVKVISGSTGWLDKWDEIIDFLQLKKGSLIYASNFSIGVNLFFALNRHLARLMDAHNQYNISVEEIHHTGKVDAPSGTALTLTKAILREVDRKNNWCFGPCGPEDIKMTSIRKDPAPGTHTIKYESAIDDIEITHTAKSRDGFALGAVLAAEFINKNQGLFTMADVLKI